MIDDDHVSTQSITNPIQSIDLEAKKIGRTILQQ